MAASETVICNLALMGMGQDLIDDIDGTAVLEEKCALIYGQERDELEAEGPELGWKFTRWRYNGIDDDAYTITAIADSATSGDITISATHTLSVGDMVELYDDTGYDDTYDVNAVSGTSTFDVTATFVATGTGSAAWRSEEYLYRFAIPTTPTVLKVVNVQSGGMELTDWVREGDYILTNQESDEVDMVIIQQITDTTKFPPYFTKALVLRMQIKLHYNLTQDLKAIQLLSAEYDRVWSKAVAMDEREKYVQEYSSSWQDAGNVNDEIE